MRKRYSSGKFQIVINRYRYPRQKFKYRNPVDGIFLCDKYSPSEKEAGNRPHIGKYYLLSGSGSVGRVDACKGSLWSLSLDNQHHLPSTGPNKHHGNIILCVTFVIFGHLDSKHRCHIEKNVPIGFVLPSRWQNGAESLGIKITICLWCLLTKPQLCCSSHCLSNLKDLSLTRSLGGSFPWSQSKIWFFCFPVKLFCIVNAPKHWKPFKKHFPPEGKSNKYLFHLESMTQWSS